MRAGVATVAALAEYYPAIKSAHVALALASGTLFALRGLLRAAGTEAGNRRPVPLLSVAIDTGLLVAGVSLIFALKLNPATTPWLAVKLLLLLAYIVLGSLALKRARTPARRGLAFVAALTCFASMYAIARAHDPLAPLRLLGL